MGGRIKGVAFDLNGTLVDSSSVALEAWLKTFEGNGFRASRRVLEGLLGAGHAKIIREVAGNVSDQVFEKLTGDFNRNFAAQIHLVKPFPDSAKALTMLKNGGLRVAVVSSYTASSAKAVLERTGLIGLVDCVVGGDEVLLGKPDPQIYSEAFYRIGVAPALGAVVGSTDYDALPAKRLGALAIVVSRDGGRVVHADLVFNNLVDAAIEILNS